MCESIGHRPLRGRCPKRGATQERKWTQGEEERRRNHMEEEIAGLFVADNENDKRAWRETFESLNLMTNCHQV